MSKFTEYLEASTIKKQKKLLFPNDNLEFKKYFQNIGVDDPKKFDKVNQSIEGLKTKYSKIQQSIIEDYRSLSECYDDLKQTENNIKYFKNKIKSSLAKISEKSTTAEKEKNIESEIKFIKNWIKGLEGKEDLKKFNSLLTPKQISLLESPKTKTSIEDKLVFGIDMYEWEGMNKTEQNKEINRFKEELKNGEHFFIKAPYIIDILKKTNSISSFYNKIKQ